MASSDLNNPVVDEFLIAGRIGCANVYVTGAKDYKRGDLLSFDVATNTVDVATDPAAARFICADDITAASATSQAAASLTIQVYSDGDFYLDGVTLAGVALTAPQKVVAQGALNQFNINLR